MIEYAKGFFCGTAIGIMVGSIAIPIILFIADKVIWKNGYLAGWIDRDKGVNLKPVGHHTDKRIFTVNH